MPRFIAAIMTLTLALSCPTGVWAQPEAAEDELKATCAIHLEGDYQIERRLKEINCVAGDTVVLYNHSFKGKWENILPVRVAAAMICDMRSPISAIGSVGAQPYQSTICTYSGNVRKLKSSDPDLKGWGQVF